MSHVPPLQWHTQLKIKQCMLPENCCLATFSVITMLALPIQWQGQSNCFFTLMMKYPVYKNLICFLLGKILHISVNHCWQVPQRDTVWEHNWLCSFLHFNREGFFTPTLPQTSTTSHWHTGTNYTNICFPSLLWPGKYGRNAAVVYLFLFFPPSNNKQN